MLPTNESQPFTEIVLKVGMEGGTFLIERFRKTGEWLFRVTVTDSQWEMIGETHPDNNRFVETQSLEEAFRTLDPYPWHLGVPLIVNSEFKVPILEKVRARIEEDPSSAALHFRTGQDLLKDWTEGR